MNWLLTILLVVPLAFAAATVEARADSDDGSADASRPRVGLVLSGGGARGAAHAGVLKVLEEHRVPVDVIVGTSIGALVGSYYATGMSPDEIIGWLERLDWLAAATDRSPRRAHSFRRKQDDHTFTLGPRIGFRDGRFVVPRGLIAGHELGSSIRFATLHTSRWPYFDDFPIPFRAVATDIERGEAVVLDSGPLADAVLASMAVPGVVAPIELDGLLLLDGGLVNNLPVDVARALGVDIIIAVDIGRPLATREGLQDIFGISAQFMAMIGREQMSAAIAELGPEDLYIKPDLSGISVSDFMMMGEAIERGVATGPVISSRLKVLSMNEDEWVSWLARQRRATKEQPRIDFIEVENQTPIADELLEARITLKPGEILDDHALRRDLDRLYSVGEFDRIEFRLLERDGRTGLGFSVTPNQLGSNTFRFGFSISEDFSGSSDYRLLFMHNRTQLNALNGEWRNVMQVGEPQGFTTELFQPITWSGEVFINPGLSISRTTVNLFAAGERRAQYMLTRRGVRLDIGRHMRNYGEARIGYFLEDIDADVRIALPGTPEFEERVAGIEWRFTLDQLDNLSFPSDAWWASLGGRHGMDRLGGSRRYGLIDAAVYRAMPLGERDSLLFGVRGGARTGGTLPFYEQFTLGGFLSLSGLREDQLRGEYQFLARVVWHRQFHQLPAGVGEGMYFGVSHERGNVWNSRQDVSLGDLRWGSAAFIGADTFFGAVYLGVGRADNGGTSAYLFLQRTIQ